ncbi:MAG TPA: hypothetical protein DCE44_21900 [Verrucomicrobiales bacterium]|nr:hypothetical protein [Verrucomicrobiales bacterium]
MSGLWKLALDECARRPVSGLHHRGNVETGAREARSRSVEAREATNQFPQEALRQQVGWVTIHSQK